MFIFLNGEFCLDFLQTCRDAWIRYHGKITPSLFRGPKGRRVQPWSPSGVILSYFIGCMATLRPTCPRIDSSECCAHHWILPFDSWNCKKGDSYIECIMNWTHGGLEWFWHMQCIMTLIHETYIDGKPSGSNRQHRVQKNALTIIDHKKGYFIMLPRPLWSAI